MRKSAPKKDLVPEVQPQALSDLWAVFEANLPYSTVCMISAVFTVIITLVFFLRRFKREINADERVGDGDKVPSDVQEPKNVNARERTDGENPDNSEGLDELEEELPWILQKAHSETSLSDDKKGDWTNDEKQSEETDSEKSQDLARIRKSAAGDLKGPAKVVKVITAVEEYICEE